MAPQKLKRLLRLWQKRLRLLDWDITVTLVSQDEIPGQEGHNDWFDEEMRSSILIVNGADEAKIEAVLVHELLHLRLSDWEVETLGDPKLERAINLLTDSFLTAYRHRKRTKEPTNV